MVGLTETMHTSKSKAVKSAQKWVDGGA
jgi:hypothetical protein